jgi:hypothetical protein
MMAWFYTGKDGKPPKAHWIEPNASVSICQHFKPDARGAVWRHPTHDRHITLCVLCQTKLKAARKPEGVTNRS